MGRPKKIKEEKIDNIDLNEEEENQEEELVEEIKISAIEKDTIVLKKSDLKQIKNNLISHLLGFRKFEKQDFENILSLLQEV